MKLLSKSIFWYTLNQVLQKLNLIWELLEEVHKCWYMVVTLTQVLVEFTVDSEQM